MSLRGCRANVLADAQQRDGRMETIFLQTVEITLHYPPMLAALLLVVRMRVT